MSWERILCFRRSLNLCTSQLIPQLVFHDVPLNRLIKGLTRSLEAVGDDEKPKKLSSAGDAAVQGFKNLGDPTKLVKKGIIKVITKCKDIPSADR